WSPSLDRLAVDEHLDGAHVSGEVASVAVRPGQGGGSDLGIVLSGEGRLVAKPCLELEYGHRLFRVEQLSGNGCPRSVARNASARIFEWHAGFGAEERDESAVEILPWDGLTAKREEQCHRFARLTIDQVGLVRTHALPGSDRIADERVDGFG